MTNKAFSPLLISLIFVFISSESDASETECIPITEPTVITEPGIYCLQNDIVGEPIGLGSFIEIEATPTTILLDGHKIEANPYEGGSLIWIETESGTSPGSQNSQRQTEGQYDVTIRGPGEIIGGQNGIRTSMKFNGGSLLVENEVLFSRQGANGISAGCMSAIRVTGSRFEKIEGNGVLAFRWKDPFIRCYEEKTQLEISHNRFVDLNRSAIQIDMVHSAVVSNNTINGYARKNYDAPAIQVWPLDEALDPSHSLMSIANNDVQNGKKVGIFQHGTTGFINVVGNRIRTELWSTSIVVEAINSVITGNNIRGHRVCGIRAPQESRVFKNNIRSRRGATDFCGS